MRALILVAVWAVVAGCGEREPPRKSLPPPSHHGHFGPYSTGLTDGVGADTPILSEKHGELLAIARRLFQGSNPFYGRRPYENLRDIDTSLLDAAARARHEYRLGIEHFKFGRAAQAESLFLSSHAATHDPFALYWAGISRLRLAELSNCIESHNAKSCLFPLEEEGIHFRRNSATRARTLFDQVLQADPKGLRAKSRFFLNLAAMAAGEYPDGILEEKRLSLDAFGAEVPIKRFRDVASDLGITTLNHAGGSIVDDFDGDGLLDIVTSTSYPDGQMIFYANRGDGSFEERTQEAGLLGQLGGLNLVHADYDGDGHLDILVLRGGWLTSEGRHPRSLLRNRGDGVFEDVTKAAGLTTSYPTQTAAFADYDLDGDLDLFIGNESIVRAELQYESIGFEIGSGSDLLYPCQLYRNEGNGTFTNVAATAGVENFRFTKGCAWGDFNADRYPDLYLSNQWGKNRLYQNRGNGTFVDVAPDLDLTEPIYSFPTWFWDYDNDGNLDLFVASYGGGVNNVIRSYLRPELGLGKNGLYRNLGTGRFRNMALQAGLKTLTLSMGANFADVDGDGWLDFYLATGTPLFDSLIPNVLYKADGAGGFLDATAAAGLGNLQKGHGVAFGDLDNDGDEDLFLQSGGFFQYDAFFNSIYENPGHENRWVTLLFEGKRSNRFAVGTRVRVRVEENGSMRDIFRWVGPQGSFGSSSMQLEIGLGGASRIEEIEVYWPLSDSAQRFRNVDLDRFYRVTEFADTLESVKRTSFSFEI